MRRIFDIFKVRREEHWIALAMAVVLCVLNGIMIHHFYEAMTPLRDHYSGTFIRSFCVSGFDPLTYEVLSDWHAAYNVYRHPLLAFYMYVPYLINMGLMKLTGINCALFIAIAIQTFCAFYSALFLTRIHREVIGLGTRTSQLLTLFYFSFAYVLLSALVPDHFIISMMLLLLALYISGRRMKSGRPLKTWQSVVYFVLTAGTSLNNGLKIYFSGLFVNGRRFFRPAYLLCAVILPAALLWGCARWEYRALVWPKEMARKELKAKQKAEKEARQARIAHERHVKDSLVKDSVQRGLKVFTQAQLAQKARKDSLQKVRAEAKKNKKREPKQGAPLMKGEFMRWTDVTTSRTQSVVDNLLGEGIQLHQDYLLRDELRTHGGRPMFVAYRYAFNYVVEALIALLFIAGLWMGRRSKFLWLTVSYFALDMFLHLGLGFGLNEVYIMSAHWMYVIPIATASLMKGLPTKAARASTALVAALTLFLLAWNGSLIIGYFS